MAKPGEGAMLLDLRFAAKMIEWRGPPPFWFLPVPEAAVGEVAYAARWASYGWGVVPVEAHVGTVAFRISLFPRDGGYLLPLKASVRHEARLTPEKPVSVRMIVRGSA